MRRIGIESDVSDRTAVNLIGTFEVLLEHQLATACHQNGVHVSSAREPIGHPAQCITIDELIFTDGGYGPSVVSRHRNAAAVGWVCVHAQSGERCQRSSTEK